MDFVRSVWRNEIQRNMLIGMTAVVIGFLVWYFVINKKSTNVIGPITTTESTSGHEVPADVPVGPIVAHRTPDRISKPEWQIASYVKDYSQLYNTDLVHVDLFTKTPIFPYHSVTFTRSGVDGTVSFAHMGKPKQGKWNDKPTAEDLTYRIPISSDKTMWYRTVGDLQFKTTDGLPIVFRKDSEGYVTVVEGLTITDDHKIEENTFRLAKLANPM